MSSKFSRKFGLIGLSIGLIATGIWWTVHLLNPFHLPTVGVAPANFQEPLASLIINDGIFVLCPGVLLQFLTLEMRGWLALLMWILAVGLNFPLYYTIGALVQVAGGARQKVAG